MLLYSAMTGAGQAVHEIILFYKIRVSHHVFSCLSARRTAGLIPLLLKNRFDADKNNNRLFAFRAACLSGYPELKSADRRRTGIGEIFCGGMSGTEERITNYLCTIPAVRAGRIVENRPVCWRC